MKRIKSGLAQTVTLDQADIPEDCEIFLTIINENGEPVKDSLGKYIADVPLAYDGESEKYQVEISINATEPSQYIRLGSVAFMLIST